MRVVTKILTDIANVVDRNSGLYAWYLSKLIVVSSLRICETSYAAPVLSNDPREDIGRYAPYQTFYLLRLYLLDRFDQV